MRALLGAATLLAASVCVAASGLRAPERLSETGLYAPGGLALAADVRAFSPQYPLWTDGAAKQRWVRLPPGAAIDTSDPLAWDLPVGTRFWKQFDFNGRRVETRMIWRAASDRWIFASYRWNDDGTDATLAPDDGVPAVAAVGANKQHSIPSVGDCAACHGTQAPGPLGFNALQLSPDRDPGAIHGEPLVAGMVTLRTLYDEGRLGVAGAALIADPPRIRTGNPRTRAMLGYLVGNCSACHNGRGEIAALGPTLKIDELLRDGDAVAHALVNQPTRWQVPGVLEGQSMLINPAMLEKSAILVRMRSRSPVSQMPPLGTVLRDQTAVERFSAWAAEIGAASAGAALSPAFRAAPVAKP